jgi:uncharacterized protein YaeQ
LAIKPTIYKFTIALSDLNRNYYDSLNLTVALHPSETHERMMARVLAYCLNVREDSSLSTQEQLSFTKGLSEIEEPDMWVRSLDEQILLWVELGEPAFERVKKASRLAKSLNVYSFNSKSDTWWRQCKEQFSHLDVSVFQFDPTKIQSLARLVQRGMNMSVTITGDSVFVAAEQGEVEVLWQVLQLAEAFDK